MDRIDAMRVFTRIVERKSFTLAADDLGLPRSTVTDAIKQLEARLGVRLLQRTTRHVSPTLDGEAYYRRCLSLIADLEEAESAFSGAKPKGLLRIDMHGTLARHVLLPALPDFLAAYPDIQIHVGEGDRLVDLIREGIDCVIRSGQPQDSQMVGRRIAAMDEAVCASPDYFAKHGMPKTPDDLDDTHRMVGFVSSASGQVLPLDFIENGRPRSVSLPATVTVSAGESMVTLARLGLGLIQVPRYHLAADFAAGRLIEVLADYRAAPMPVSVLYPGVRQLSPRVRVFIEWTTKLFAEKAALFSAA